MSKLTPETHPHLTNNIIEALITKNIATIHEFLDADVKYLTTITKLTYKNILIIRKHIINKNAAITQTANDYYQEYVKKTAIVTTGVNCIDTLIAGGLYTGNIYEICGLPNTGKTQLCFNIIIKNATDFDHKIYYIDTKKDFCIPRLKNMINSNDEVFVSNILKKILIKEVHTCYELINALYEIKRDLSKNLKLRIIIIDSLPALFYENKQTNKDKSVINSIINVMKLIANEFHVVFVVVNFITIWWENMFTGNPTSTEKIGCGNIWLNVPNTRLKLTNLLDNVFEVEVLKSALVKEGLTCFMKINESGLIS